MWKSFFTRDALVFFGGLFALATLAALGSSAISINSLSTGTPAPFIFQPALYSLGWFLLVVRSIWAALASGAILSASLFGLMFVGLWIGYGLLLIKPTFIPLSVAMCAAAFGFVVGLLHGGFSKNLKKIWMILHIVGYGFAGIVVASPMILIFLTSRFQAISAIFIFGAAIWIVLEPVLAYGPHAVLSWYKLRRDGYAQPPAVRIASAFMIAYAGLSGYLWSINPQHWTLIWPVHYREMAAAARNDRKSAEQDLRAMWGTLEGRTLSRGEAAALVIDNKSIDLAPPTGWAARVWDGSGRNNFLRDWFVLRWAEDPAKSVVDRIRVDQVRWGTSEMRSRPEPVLPGARSIRRARLFRCGPGSARTAGLIVCTPADEYPGRREAVTAPDGLFAEPQGAANFVFHTRYPGSVHGSISILGGTFLAECRSETTCQAVFSFASGAATVTVDFRASHLHSWRDIRREVDAVLRAATGQGLDQVSMVSQPEGELLPMPP